MIRRPSLIHLLLAALLLAAAPAAALETADGKLTVSAYGSAGYGRTDGNVYGPGTEDGSYENTQLALAFIGRPADRLLIAAQVFFTSAETPSIDWAFAEWKLHDALRLRLGKAKHPFGLYGETRDIGTLRPFFTLPTSVYGPTHLVAEGYTGVGLTGFYRLAKGWSLGYDVYGGQLQTAVYESFEQLFPGFVGPAGELEEAETRDLLGGRLTLETPVEGLSFMVSSYTGVETHEGEHMRHVAVAGSAEYLTEAISARAEYALIDEEHEASTHSAYVELAYKFPVGIQLAARAEGSWSTVDELTGSSPLTRHREAALGVNYWFSPDLVVKASYHLVDGNRFAYSPTQTPATLDESTRLFVLGAQFSF
jgi:opacity protein-like surface antigen